MLKGFQYSLLHTLFAKSWRKGLRRSSPRVVLVPRRLWHSECRILTFGAFQVQNPAECSRKREVYLISGIQSLDSQTQGQRKLETKLVRLLQVVHLQFGKELNIRIELKIRRVEDQSWTKELFSKEFSRSEIPSLQRRTGKGENSFEGALEASKASLQRRLLESFSKGRLKRFLVHAKKEFPKRFETMYQNYFNELFKRGCFLNLCSTALCALNGELWVFGCTMPLVQCKLRSKTQNTQIHSELSARIVARIDFKFGAIWNIWNNVTTFEH